MNDLKAKTTSDIYEFVKNAKLNNADYKDEKWVRLEDAEKELAELKQKLQQFKNLLSKENEPKLHIGSANFTNIALFRMHMEKLRKKFEELLEEEKAKPC
jgi:mevalonate pyrophosphate decarboxylase